MEIKKAVFVKSSSGLQDCPKPEKPEYAFIGRSNVGKSSLINMLCGRKDMARISSTPGKTITINHYLIDDKWFIVDLPGYGYAKRSKSLRAEWDKNMVDYFSLRENLQCVFVLIDSRIEAQEIDLEFMSFLGENEIPFSIVFTKMDKNSRAHKEKHLEAYKKKLFDYWEELPQLFFTSSENKSGRAELLKYISGVNRDFVKPY